MSSQYLRGALLVSCLVAIAASRPLPSGDAHSRASRQRPALDTLAFDRVLLLEPTGETSANVSIGDVNGDGHLDLVLAKGRHWPLVDRVLLGDGAGNFPTAYDLGAASDRTYSGRLVDLDRDGDLDVVISNDTPDPKLTYLNDGKGRFTVGSSFGRAEWPTRNATVADVDGDGLPDIVVANRGEAGTANWFCLNRGAGRFDADCTAFSRVPSTTVTAADFNGDGMIDLAAPHRDGGQSRIHLAGPRGRFRDDRSIAFGPADASIRMAEAADLDGDGRLDIVAIDDRARTTTVYLAQRDGSFSPGMVVGERRHVPYALTLADLDGDGRTDVVVGHVQAPSIAWFNEGGGRRFRGVPFGDGQGAAYGFAVADLDRDGVMDIAVARSDAPNAVHFGRRTGARAGAR